MKIIHSDLAATVTAYTLLLRNNDLDMKHRMNSRHQQFGPEKYSFKGNQVADIVEVFLFI